jgi:hypothetical protein
MVGACGVPGQGLKQGEITVAEPERGTRIESCMNIP